MFAGESTCSLSGTFAQTKRLLISLCIAVRPATQKLERREMRCIPKLRPSLLGSVFRRGDLSGIVPNFLELTVSRQELRNSKNSARWVRLALAYALGELTAIPKVAVDPECMTRTVLDPICTNSWQTRFFGAIKNTIAHPRSQFPRSDSIWQ
jgi:hypothetical protein